MIEANLRKGKPEPMERKQKLKRLFFVFGALLLKFDGGTAQGFRNIFVHG
jgi:hypothetical protein